MHIGVKMFNKLIAIGNLTRDIELKSLSNGTYLAKSAIATSYSYKDSTGQSKEEVCFIDFTIFGRVAETANKYLHKGSKVMLEGRLIFETWVGTDGQNHSKHSLRVDEFKFLDSKSNSNSSFPSREVEKTTIQAKKQFVNFEDLDEPPF